MKCSYCDKEMKKADVSSSFLFICDCGADKLSREIYEDINKPFDPNELGLSSWLNQAKQS